MVVGGEGMRSLDISLIWGWCDLVVAISSWVKFGGGVRLGVRSLGCWMGVARQFGGLGGGGLATCLIFCLFIYFCFALIYNMLKLIKGTIIHSKNFIVQYLTYVFFFLNIKRFKCTMSILVC